MELNGFSVSVPEGMNESSDGYVEIKHGQQFSIRLHNSHKCNGYHKPCDCEVFVDGKPVGSFRLDAGQTVLLERSVNDNGRFTAYKRDTQEAAEAMINADSDSAGLIHVVFRPGQKYSTKKAYTPYPSGGYPTEWNTGYTRSYYNSTSTACYDSATLQSTNTCKRMRGSGSDFVSGGVGLSGSSDQSFYTVTQLDYDEPETTVYLRLRFREGDVRPLQPVHRVEKRESDYPRPIR